MRKITLKIQVLRFVAEQRFVKAEDICERKFWRSNKLDTVRVTMNQLGLACIKYGNIKYGVRFIDDPELIKILKEHYDDMVEFKIRPAHPEQILHALRVNHIRNILENSSKIKIVKWWSEEYLRSLPFENWEGIRSRNKIPDAIFWQEKKDGSMRKFFLEYERSLKNNGRYEEIFKFYEGHRDIKEKSVLYVCENEFIKKRLIGLEEILAKKGRLKTKGEYFQFVTMEEFNQSFSTTTQKEEGHGE